MYKQDLALNNLQWLICHKTKSISFPHLNCEYIVRQTGHFSLAETTGLGEGKL